MLLRILHHTQYDYQAPVVLAQHLAHLHPLDLPDQQVLAHTLRIDPEPAHQEESRDAFGNWRTFFALQSPHSSLSVTADSLVRTSPPGELDDSLPWEELRDHLRYRFHAPYEPVSEFVFASPYVPRHEAFADFARSAFKPDCDFLQACHALMDKIHTTLQYESASTVVNTPALEALKQGKGVCQDFAHIMLACLRTLGLPGRYVSGYLLTQPPPGKPRLIGADASHAWVAVHANDRWYDFDPTNNRCGAGRPGEDYVTLTMGRDFGDVSPLRGVIQSGGAHTLSVGVTVAPPDEFAAQT